MSNVDFTDEIKLSHLVQRSSPSTPGGIFKMFFKMGIVRSIDQAFYLCVGVSIFFFCVSAIIIVTAL